MSENNPLYSHKQHHIFTYLAPFLEVAISGGFFLLFTRFSEVPYRYSPAVYNNFPWPEPTATQKSAIEQTAQGILDARAKYPDCSLADLYDETTMPPELRKAHQQNDRAVMQAYGFSLKMTESECVAELMKLYQKLTEK